MAEICKSPNCSREVDDKDLELTDDKTRCIFHCDKKDWNNKLNNDSVKIEYFWEKVREYITYIDKDKTDTNYFKCPSNMAKKKKIYLFEDFIFPSEDESSGNYLNVYEDKTFFSKEKFYQFEKELKFINCTFLSSINFVNIKFKRDVVFENCIFKDKVLFNGIVSEGNFTIIVSNKNYKNEKYNIKDLVFSGAIFKGDVKLKRLILKKSDFDNCIFEKEVDFYKTKFNLTSFKRSEFKGNCIFDETTFIDTFDTYEIENKNKETQNMVKFNLTKFQGIVSFNNCNIEKSLDLTTTYFYNKSNFLGISSIENKFECINVANRETARIIKDSFEQQNNIIEANKFYALEMKEREKELKDDIIKGKNFFEYLVFLFHGLSSNHSQNWLLSLFWIFTFTFGYAAFSCYEFKSDYIFWIFIITFSIVAFVIAILLNQYIDDKTTHATFIIVLSFIIYSAYGFFMNDFKLYTFSNKINPFSTMTEFSDLTFLTLIYKIIIAYLIYQLIISIRQNTRRK